MRYFILLLFAPLTLAAPPNADAEKAAKRATVPAGMTVSLWAAEPLLANPVAITFDEQGRCYVAETTRFDKGVPDTRGHQYWLDDDIACRSVADRLAMYKKYKYGNFEAFDDQVRRVWDSAGQGVVDKSIVFAKGFNKPEDGLAAGVLARHGDLFLACIPSLYRFSALDAVEPKKEILSTGYGIRVQFLGHDLHGLRMGPDGRIYFTIGDRGFNVVNKEGKRLFNPDSGAVLRCEPDGANLEIVHIGLRNPQKLAFDDYGNLFTFDNNCDSGDSARWVQIVPGGDSGWRCGYQWGTLYHTPAVPQGNRGPWNSEKLWHLPHEGQPAYIVPPLAHFGNGPAGICHYPGLGLSEKYKDHFFATDFTSTPGSSVIWSLAVKPKGASFEVVDLQKFVTQMVPTDCEFGPDSNFYWSDWTGGWDPPGKGRIFKVTDAEAQTNPLVKEAKELIAGGIGKKTIPELIKLLEHPHQWVRQEAQFELAGNSRQWSECLVALVKSLNESKNRLARLHAVWAIGQICRREKPALDSLFEMLKDPDSEIRASAATMLSEAAGVRLNAYEKLLPLLKDTEPRVQAKSAYALARVAKPKDLSVQAKMDIAQFAKGAEPDPYLRHGAVSLLASLGYKYIFELNLNPNAPKLVVALAFRKSGASEEDLKKLLYDKDQQVAVETARAIYDERMTKALPRLAELANLSHLPEPIIFRALAANLMIGDEISATRLARFAASGSEPDYLRGTALKLLGDWPKPPERDPITGLTLRSNPKYEDGVFLHHKRDAAVAKAALAPHLEAVFHGGDSLRKAAVDCVRKLGIPEVGPVLAKMVADAKLSANVRVEAIFAMQELKVKELGEVLPVAATSPDVKLKGAARVVRMRENPKALDEFAAILNDGKTTAVEKQMILAALPDSDAANKLIADWVDKLIAGTVPPELRLEVLEAAEKRNSRPLKAKLREYDRAVRAAAGEKLDKRYPEALVGGDAEKGREVFLNNAAVSCQKCHKLDGQGGDVGPPLKGIGKEKTREYLLESIVVPNAQIAQGYQSVILNLSDGKTVSGVLRKKTKEKYTLMTPDNKLLEIAAEDVESEKPDKSAMPDDLHKKLSKRELRDLVEFLANLRN